ncbi:MAG TPA: hypothetical protein VI357_27680 [Mycobacteriales bacterium]
MTGLMDLAILVSADKDYRYALIQVRDLRKIDLEVAIWQAIPGRKTVGRIELRPERQMSRRSPAICWGDTTSASSKTRSTTVRSLPLPTDQAEAQSLTVTP